MKNVLLIAGLQERYYFQPFIDACSGMEVCIYVCDPSRYPREASLNFFQDEKGNICGQIDVLILKKDAEPKQVALEFSDVQVAWYLRENPQIKKLARKTTVASRFAENETRQAIRACLSVLSCRWVNRKDSIDRVHSNKFYQQLIAAQCGLLTPRTIISNSPKAVECFSREQDGLLLKTIGYVQLDPKGVKALYSERFSHAEISRSAGAIRSCPVYAQEYIEKRYEYRVMIIGNRVLSCRIDSQASNVSKIDWRHYDFERVAHIAIELPDDMQQKLLRFMDRINLRYGAIDLIETPDGDFVFLEVNPSGQWGWIHDLSELPIPDAVATMLRYI